MMHEDWVKYDEWTYAFVKERLKSKNSNATLKYFKKTIGDIYNNKSIQLIIDGKRAKSLEYTIKALKIYEEVDDKWRLSSGYSNIGNYYQEDSDFKTALEYYQKALDIAEKADDKDNIAICYLSIGSVFEEQGKIDEALKNYENSLQKIKEFGDISRTPQCLNNIGNIYELKEEYDSSLEYYNESLEINIKIGSKDGESHSLKNLAQLYLKIGEIDKAYSSAKRSLAMALDLGYPASIQNSSKVLSDILEKQGKGMEALKMFKIHIAMADSLSKEEENAKTVRLQAEYEYDKQKVIDDSQHDKLIAVEHESKKKQQIITWFAIAGLVLVVAFLILIYKRLQLTKKQKEVIENQKEEVELAHHQLGEKTQELTDSIIYAKRIQSAILPPQKVVKKYLENSFIYYKPKDIVAGDFYWLETKENKILFAVADCTGHGVPGAMVSVVCNNALNRSVREHGLTKPGEILDKTRSIVIEEFEKSDDIVNDGMDIALCSLEGYNLQYAGAHNPLWIIRKGEILETKADKQPIGQSDKPLPYTTHNIKLEQEDTVYIFSDGYVDQFGGEKGKKFKSRAFRELLLSIQNKSMEEQKEFIEQVFEKWRGNLEQIDDICIIGLKIE
jgi:serine phosphatase RsbU (regulator of sigma subunit)/Tfp pilus assembly protein PilF